MLTGNVANNAILSNKLVANDAKSEKAKSLIGIH